MFSLSSKQAKRGKERHVDFKEASENFNQFSRVLKLVEAHSFTVLGLPSVNSIGEDWKQLTKLLISTRPGALRSALDFSPSARFDYYFARERLISSLGDDIVLKRKAFFTGEYMVIRFRS